MKTQSMRSRLALTVASVALLGSYGRLAQAGNCTGAGGVYLCAGPAGSDTTQVLSGAPLVVTTQPGFGINTAAGDAFTLTGTGGLSFIDTTGAAITGAADGIDAANTGDGLVTITATGTVTGIAGTGVRVTNVIEGDANLTLGSVSGGVDGISAQVSAGDITITATGSVTGLTNDGIYAHVGVGETTIHAAAITGQRDGVLVAHGLFYADQGGAVSITTTGKVTGTTRNGIAAEVNQGPLTIVAAEVLGGEDGIDARIVGAGSVEITATGAVTGTSGIGINVNNTGSGKVTIAAAAVTGRTRGMEVQSYGGVDITATGLVKATAGTGLHITEQSVGDLKIAASAVQGTIYGIVATNTGGGALSIITTGVVSGGSQAGVDARDYGGGDLSVAVAGASGTTYGIRALNQAGGKLTVTATGAVTASGYGGIEARDYGTGALEVGVAGVTGQRYGIRAINQGGGDLDVTASGAVTALWANGVGIEARDSLTGKLTVTAVDVTGGAFGIHAFNDGGGDLKVTATGTVIGLSAAGIYARETGTEKLIVEAATVTGYTTGIEATNNDAGDVSITTTGAVTGQTAAGIAAVNAIYGGTLTIRASGAVTGATQGIYVSNAGASLRVTLEAGGAAVGGTVGLSVLDQSGGVTVDNAGVIQQTAGGFAQQAISITSFSGTPTVLDNRASGTIVGLVTLSVGGALFNNDGLWANAGGVSSFGNNISGVLDNRATGTVRVGSGAAAEITTWTSQAAFQNAGLLDFRDGGVGDELGTSGHFVGLGGVVAFDAVLDVSGSPADLLRVGGNTSGTTAVLVTAVGGEGAATGTGPGSGIALIAVAGATEADDFALLGGPVGRGAYAYDLVLESDSVWYLQSTLRSDQLASFANAITAAQTQVDVMFGPLGERMAALRGNDPQSSSSGQSAALGVSDLADAGTAPHGSGGIGVWGKAVGQHGDYDPAGAPDFEQQVYGFAAGADIGFGGLLGEDDRTYLGLQVGYGHSDVDHDDGSELGLDGWSVGLYATWVGDGGTASPYDGPHLDLLAHVSFLNADLTTTAPASTADFDTLVWGGAIEAGYGLEIARGLILEPSARLAYSRVEADDTTDSLGTDVRFDEGDSLQGRLALRLQKHWGLYSLGQIAPYVEAHVSHEFLGDNQVTADGFSFQSDVGGTSYGVAFGLDAAIGRNLAIFGAAELTWGERLEQQTQVTGGLRFSF